MAARSISGGVGSRRSTMPAPPNQAGPSHPSATTVITALGRSVRRKAASFLWPFVPAAPPGPAAEYASRIVSRLPVIVAVGGPEPPALGNATSSDDAGASAFGQHSSAGVDVVGQSPVLPVMRSRAFNWVTEVVAKIGTEPPGPPDAMTVIGTGVGVPSQPKMASETTIPSVPSPLNRFKQ
jgi:hypothetical protein